MAHSLERPQGRNTKKITFLREDPKSDSLIRLYYHKVLLFFFTNRDRSGSYLNVLFEMLRSLSAFEGLSALFALDGSVLGGQADSDVANQRRFAAQRLPADLAGERFGAETGSLTGRGAGVGTGNAPEAAASRR